MNITPKRMRISKAFSYAWETFKDNAAFIIPSSLLLTFFNQLLLLTISFYVPLMTFGMDMGLLVIAAMAIVMVFSWAFYAGYVGVMLDLVRGRPVDLTGFITKGLTRFWSFLWLYFVLIAGIFGGLLLLLIPGIYLMIRWFFAQIIFVDKRVSVGEAMEQSAEIVKGNWWHIFALFFAGILIASVPASIIGYIILLATSLDFATGFQIGSSIVGIITMPFMLLAYIYYYLYATSELTVE